MRGIGGWEDDEGEDGEGGDGGRDEGVGRVGWDDPRSLLKAWIH